MNPSNRQGLKPSKQHWKIPVVTCIVLFAGSVFAMAGEHSETVAAQALQQITVTGAVTDEAGETMPGVNILIKGTTVGVVTDAGGKFSIPVPNRDAVLVFSFIGYVSREMEVGDNRDLQVTLVEDTQQLEEVVVVGYGVQKKRLVTGATVQVKGEQIAALNTVNTLGALQGQTPGVNITKVNGKPGEGFHVVIRGLGTIGDARPLFIIDGVVGADINVLNTTDIESVDVLKDAASAAIYGARAANGVIMVTTKQGRPGKAVVQYDGYLGLQNIYKKAPLLNAKEYAFIMNEANMSDGKPLWDFASLVPNWDQIQAGTWNGTNWLEEMMNKDAPIQNHALNITGGTDRSVYSLGLGYTTQDGTIGGKNIESNYQRFTVRINTEHTLFKHKDFDLLKAGENLTFAYTQKRGLDIGTDDIYWNDINNALKANPFQPAYNDDGSYHGAIAWYPEEMNPIADLYYGRSQSATGDYYLKGNVYMTLQPVKNLIYRMSFGATYSAGRRRAYSPSFYLDRLHFKDSEEDQVSASMYMGLSWLFENTISYDFRLMTNHHFNVLAGTSAERWGLGESMDGSNTGSIFTDFDHAWLSNTKRIDPARTYVSGGPWGKGGLLSYFGRINYNFKERYMASAVMRTDGSSNFAKGHRWGVFPSVSAGWDISREAFMEPANSWLNQLKVRASWGQNGNQSIPNFQYLSTISFDGVDYFFGTDKKTKTTGAYPDILANPDVTWETSEQTDIGLDASFLKNRLSFVFDWYNKLTKDWLVRAPVLDTYGTGAPYVNGGDVRNRGIEVSVGWNDHIRDFRYGVRANLSKNVNKVLRIANEEGIIYGPIGVLSEGTEELFRAQVGYPIGYFIGYQTSGIFQNEKDVLDYVRDGQRIQPDARPGDLRYIDQNGDGKITPEDRVMMGNPHPDMTFGLALNAEWKGFDLSVMTNGMLGYQIAKSYRSFASYPRQNYTRDILGYWHGEGTSNTIPRLTSGTHIDWQYISERFIENGDYWRISNITFGYDFKRIMKNVPISQLRLYVAVQNLYTLTGYSGMDPEIGYGGEEDWASSIDLGYYPSPRTVMVGVSIKF